MLIGEMSIYQILWYFVIYSVLGWCVEVAYHAVTLGKVVNRGFLNGPVCPVYGFGMLAVLIVFNTISADVSAHSGLALFLGGMLLATTIELIGGWALDKLFHARWWDYSNEKFNFHGYICLKFSLIWGLGTVFVYKLVHTSIALGVSLWPVALGWFALVISYLTYATDLCVTVATVRGLNRDLAELDELRAKLRIVSDSLSEHIGENTIRTTQAIDEGKVQASLAKKELEDQAAAVKARADELRTQAEERTARNVEELKTRTEQLKEETRARAAGNVQKAKQLQKEIEAETAWADAREQQAKDQRIAELRARYETVRARLYKHPVFGAGRLMRAFPNAVHRDHNELMQEFRRKLEAGHGKSTEPGQT